MNDKNEINLVLDTSRKIVARKKNKHRIYIKIPLIWNKIKYWYYYYWVLDTWCEWSITLYSSKGKQEAYGDFNFENVIIEWENINDYIDEVFCELS